MTAETVMAPVHPGEILLEEFLGPLGVSQYKLAKAVGVPARRTNEIIHGQRRISADVTSVVADPALVGLPDDQVPAYAATEGRALVTANIKDFVPSDSRYRAAGQSRAGLVRRAFLSGTPVNEPARKNPRSRATAPLPRKLLPATAQPPLHALAVLAATATAAAAPAVRVREKRPRVSPGAAAGRAAAERVHPERYQVEDSEQDDQYDNPPHASD